MIFLDSSFIVAFEVDGDTNHIDAVRSMREVVLGKHGPPAISDYIFDEVVTVTFARTRSPARARQVGEAMLESFRMLKVDEGIFKDAWRQFRAQKHTKFSFTDSTTA
jgi:predicted nucleic acid-binding protein